MSDETNQDLEKDIHLGRSPDVIESISDNPSWFGEHDYRWPTAALPIAYAMACVEVACESSEKAGGLFQKIIEACGKPGIKTVFEKILSNAEKEELKQMVMGWETEFAKDVNKRLLDIDILRHYTN